MTLSQVSVLFFFFLIDRRPPRSPPLYSSAASDVYKRQVQRVADEAQGRWQVGKVNVDEQPELARQFGIMSIPTVMVFKNGALHAQAVGVQTQQKLEEMLQNAL